MTPNELQNRHEIQQARLDLDNKRSIDQLMNQQRGERDLLRQGLLTQMCEYERCDHAADWKAEGQGIHPSYACHLCLGDHMRGLQGDVLLVSRVLR